MSDRIQDQPAPEPNERMAVWDLVIDDMRVRDLVGRERYGTPLQAHNGRDALVDAYQEALDLAVYLRQAIEERDGGARVVPPPAPRMVRARVCVVVDELGNYGAASGEPEKAVDWAMDTWIDGCGRYNDDDPAPMLRTVWVEADVPLPVVEREAAEVAGTVPE